MGRGGERWIEEGEGDGGRERIRWHDDGVMRREVRQEVIAHTAPIITPTTLPPHHTHYSPPPTSPSHKPVQWF